MNRSAHIAAGVAACELGYLRSCAVRNKRPDLLEALAFGGAGALLGCLYDLLEPAIHPHHRAFFHGIVFNVGLAVGLKLIWDNPNLAEETRWVGVILGLGTLSHAVLDATTPQGLPMG